MYTSFLGDWVRACSYVHRYFGGTGLGRVHMFTSCFGGLG